MHRAFSLLLLLSSSLFAQSVGSQSSPIIRVAALPGTCNAGQVAFLTTAGTLHVCSAANTWSALPQMDAGGNFVIGTTVISPTAGILLPISKVTAASTNVSLGVRYLCDRAGCSFALPLVTSANASGVACAVNWTGRSGAIVWTLPATTTATVDGTAYSVSVTSSAEAGASSCVQAVGVGEYLFLGGKGTWTGSNL